MANDRVNTLILGRRERIQRALGRPLPGPAAGSEEPLDEDARAHLMEDAQELYWNEMEWERITEEESTDGVPLVTLVFPGFFAFVRGLLLQETMPDAMAPAQPRPEVVEEIVRFLARRVLELEEELSTGEPDEPERLRGELFLTDHLIDHLLYEYHGLTREDVERIEAGTVPAAAHRSG